MECKFKERMKIADAHFVVTSKKSTSEKMARKIFHATAKKCITYRDKEIEILDKLIAYFSKHPSQNISYIESCHDSMCRTGRISQTQYEVLRSIWNNLDTEIMPESGERC